MLFYAGHILSNVTRQNCPNVTELILSQLTYTTDFLPLFNIDGQSYNNSQIFSAQWAYTENIQVIPMMQPKY